MWETPFSTPPGSAAAGTARQAEGLRQAWSEERQAEGLCQAVGQGAETRVLGGGVAVARSTTHRLVVELMDHHVVEQQRAQIAKLQEELAALKLSYNRLEFSYGCTVSMLSQVTDYCQEHDFRLPKRLLDDPRKLFPASVAY